MSRPTVITDLVVQKLEEAFALGCSDEEACIYADICKQSLYNFQERNPEFLDRKTLLKNSPILKARRVVIDSFEKNPHIAFKYLERKKRDEFNQRMDIINLEIKKPIPLFDYVGNIQLKEAQNIL